MKGTCNAGGAGTHNGNLAGLFRRCNLIFRFSVNGKGMICNKPFQMLYGNRFVKVCAAAVFFTRSKAGAAYDSWERESFADYID